MALVESWHVRSRSRECSATQRPFHDGETIVTALYPDPESSGYLRRDFALDAWNERPTDAEQPFSFWKTTFAAPSANATAEIRKLSMEELFHRLVIEDQDHTENTRYILAVMLERQKLLRETDNQRTPTGILRVYEHRKTGEVYLIRDPNIPLDQVESIQTEVMELLENDGRVREEVSGEEEEVSGQQSTVSGEEEEVSGQQSAVSGEEEEEEVSGQQSTVSGEEEEEEVSRQQSAVSGEEGEVSGKEEEVTGHGS